MGTPHILSSRQFTEDFIRKILFNARYQRGFVESRAARRAARLQTLQGRTIAIPFWQPSLRTRTSFELAAKYLGAEVTIVDNASQSLAVAKGESLEHTILYYNEVGVDAIVLRHPSAGAPFRAALVSTVPVINAGSGGRGGEHPTQTLADIYTLALTFGDISKITIAFSGDMTGRACRSLVFCLSRIGIARCYFVAPPGLGIENDVRKCLLKHTVPHEEYRDLETLLLSRKIDVLYMTRLQKENLPRSDTQKAACLDSDIKSTYLTDAVISKLSKRVRVMHPLPIDREEMEIAPSFDSDPRALYFTQEKNGLFVRMALFDTLFSRPDTVPERCE